MSILLYWGTAWTLTKRIEKNLTRMLRAILNISGKKHPTKQQLFGHLTLICKTIQIRRTRHAGHCLRSKNELISNVLLWTLSYRRASVERPTWTYLQQLSTGCSVEGLPEVMDDRDEWRERLKETSASCMTWWWTFDMVVGGWICECGCVCLYAYRGEHLNTRLIK